MEAQVDQVSGRTLIEGRGLPIDGGIFRRKGQPGITVDLEKITEKFPWFSESLNFIKKTDNNLLGLAVSLANLRAPINSNSQSIFMEKSGIDDRYSLASFILNSEETETGKSKATPDAQALFIAMLIEARLKEEKYDRRVAIVKDKTDGHAVVMYQGKNGDVRKFDPTLGDKKFVNLSNH